MNPASVGRSWAAPGLQPHRVKTCKLSSDRRFAEKLEDMVGLSLSLTYDYANNIDLLAVLQTRAGANAVLASFSNYTNHRPHTATDAAGQSTTLSYNGHGQIDKIGRAHV